MEFRYCIDPTVALFKVIEITVNCVLARNGVIEVAILDHHLRLHETGLGPLQHGKIVARSVIANTDSPLVSPVGDVGQPRFMLILSTGLRAPSHKPLIVRHSDTGICCPLGGNFESWAKPSMLMATRIGRFLIVQISRRSSSIERQQFR